MTRSASAHWSGSLSDGTGTISTESGTLSETAYSFESRFESGQGTNPEELVGAAHAGCFTMQLSHMLAEAGHPPAKAETTAKVHIEKVEGVGQSAGVVDVDGVAFLNGRHLGARG